MSSLGLPGSLAELLRDLPDAIVVTTADGRITAVNANLCELAGYEAHELIDSPIEILVPRPSRAQHVALRTAYIGAGGGARTMSSRLDIVLLRSDGVEVPVDIALSTIPYAEDHVVVATVRDASVRRRVELSIERERAFLTAMNDVSRALLDGKDIDETLDLVTRRSRELLDADLAMLVLPDPHDDDALVVRYADGLGAPELVGNTLPAFDSMAGIAIRDHEPALIADGTKDARLFRPPGWPGEIGATLIVPLYTRDETVGSITIARTRGRPMFLATDVIFMNTFAAHATLAIADARQQEQLRLLRALDERDRMAESIQATVAGRLYNVGLTLHLLLQHDLPDEVSARVWTAIAELDETVAAVRDAIFPY